jgi:hypothetical protein
MKFIFGKYPSRLVCNIHMNHMRRKYGFNWSDNHTFTDRLIEKIDDAIQSVYNVVNVLWLDNRKQKIKLRLDDHDVWSMYTTLSHIILPSLIKLKTIKHGSPIVEYSDVPPELRPTDDEIALFKLDGTTDEKFHQRWEWVIDEMIFAFSAILHEDDFSGEHDTIDIWKQHQARIANGTLLFGKYYQDLWD